MQAYHCLEAKNHSPALGRSRLQSSGDRRTLQNSEQTVSLEERHCAILVSSLRVMQVQQDLEVEAKIQL